MGVGPLHSIGEVAEGNEVMERRGRQDGITHVATLVGLVEDPQSSVPESARIILKLLVDTFTALDGQIAALDAEINRRSKADPTARRLMTIPGCGADCLRTLRTGPSTRAPRPQPERDGRCLERRRR